MPEIAWPQTLVEELADRRATIILGAGSSASSVTPDGTKPPDWQRLLEGLLPLLSPTNQAVAKHLLDKQQFLDAAEIISTSSNQPDFSKRIRSLLKEPNYQASRMHKAVFDIDPKIVVTTNYDQIYERYCDAAETHSHNVCRYYEPHALNDIRSTTRCILKAHGCVTDPTQIVLSRSSYFNARRANPSFFAILDSLLLLNTSLFVGTSLADPDIQLMLENANLSAPCEHPHYALVQSGRHISITQAIRRTYNIELIEYDDPSHEAALSAMENLRDSVIALRSERGQP